MRVVARFSMEDLPKVSFVYGFGAPMYLSCRSRLCVDMVVEALRNDGFLGACEAARVLALAEAEGVGGLDYLAGVSPYAWREMIFLHGFTQERSFGGVMAVPFQAPSLVLAGLASLGNVREVGVEAWLLPRRSLLELLRVAESVVSGELVLFFRGSVAHVYDSLVMGARPESRLALGNLGLYRTGFDEDNLGGLGSSGNKIVFSEYGGVIEKIYPWRERKVDLLRLAFGDGAQLARDLLSDVLENGGAVVLKSLLDFTREDKEYMGIFEKLVDYGYLRMAGVPPQIVITEKGLYALRK